MPLIPIPGTPEEWHALRQRYVGASEVAALFGLQASYGDGILSLWHTKAGNIPRKDIGNERTRWGLLLEDAIATAAAESEGWNVLPGQYATHPCGLGATLDRIIEAPGPNDAGVSGPGVLELKSVDWLVHRRTWVNAEPPLHITLQLQAQLLTTGMAWGAVAALVGGNQLEIYRFVARRGIHAEMAARASAFWASIAAGEEPNADESVSAWQAMAATIALDGRPQDEALDLAENAEANALAEEWITQDAIVKAAEKRRDAAKNRLAQIAGEASRAVGAGWRLSLVDVAGTAPSVITAEMVGKTINGRAGHRRAAIKRDE